MQSKAQTVAAYLKELPEDRRIAMSAVREVILQNLDAEFQEGMQYGMIGYCVPHSVYPAGYHCDPKQPLPFACLASQKNYMSLYLMSAYGNEEADQQLRAAFLKAGKKLDMGKSCIRFKKLADLPLDVIGAFIGRLTARQYVESYEAALKRSVERKPIAAKKSTKRAKGVDRSFPHHSRQHS